MESGRPDSLNMQATGGIKLSAVVRRDEARGRGSVLVVPLTEAQIMKMCQSGDKMFTFEAPRACKKGAADLIRGVEGAAAAADAAAAAARLQQPCFLRKLTS